MACPGNLCQPVLATAQGRLVAASEWVLNEKRLTERAGLDAIQDRLARPWPELGVQPGRCLWQLDLERGAACGYPAAGRRSGGRSRSAAARAVAARLVAGLSDAVVSVLGEQTRSGTSVELVATPEGRVGRGGAISE